MQSTKGTRSEHEEIHRVRFISYHRESLMNPPEQLVLGLEGPGFTHRILYLEHFPHDPSVAINAGNLTLQNGIFRIFETGSESLGINHPKGVDEALEQNLANPWYHVPTALLFPLVVQEKIRRVMLSF